MKKFLHLSIVLGLASLVAKFVLEKFIIRSDENDTEGFILQSDGPGLDDIAVFGVIGGVGALALSWFGPH